MKYSYVFSVVYVILYNCSVCVSAQFWEDGLQLLGPDPYLQRHEEPVEQKEPPADAPPAMATNPAAPAMATNHAPPAMASNHAPPAMATNPAPPAMASNPAPPAMASNPAPPAMATNLAPPAMATNPEKPAGLGDTSRSVVKKRLARLCEPRADGTFKVPKELVDQWKNLETREALVDEFVASDADKDWLSTIRLYMCKVGPQYRTQNNLYTGIERDRFVVCVSFENAQRGVLELTKQPCMCCLHRVGLSACCSSNVCACMHANNTVRLTCMMNSCLEV